MFQINKARPGIFLKNRAICPCLHLWIGLQDLMCIWQVTFLGDGPLGQMTTIATEKGFVKGFVGNPSCDPPLKPTGKVRFLLKSRIMLCNTMHQLPFQFS